MSGVQPVVQMRGIVRRFGSVQALRGADFLLAPGEVHALLGENGAGKSTMMHVLFGMTRPDEGTVEVFGRPLPPGSPRAAMDAGIGMVHQHFSQVPRMTVAENVWLGRPGWRFPRRAAEAAVRRIGEDTGLQLDPGMRAEDLSAGLKQRLEIVKALSRDTRVLILDEPTGVLTPGEVDELFRALRRMAGGGMSIVLITHKLREVAAIATRVTVLRRGSVVLTGAAADYGAEDLARAMVGDGMDTGAAVATIEGRPADPNAAARRVGAVLQVRDLVVRGTGGRAMVNHVTFDVPAGEVVGIAAVEGNGQRELLRALAGFLDYEGEVVVGHGGDVGFVPEDRQQEGLILDFSLTENLALGGHNPFWLDRRFLEHQAATAIDDYAIRTSGTDQPVRTLSGGNQQRVVLARVLEQRPALLVAENPTRGLDIRATADIHERIRRAARERGLGVLFHSTDLDEVLSVSDRVAVMSAGRWQWVDEPRDRERVGELILAASP